MRKLEMFPYTGTKFETLRNIHLDFHTPEFVEVGNEFNAEEFASTLSEAKVNNIAIFAHCHHGYSYFETETGTKHPGLKIDLVGEMTKALQAKDIEVMAYFSLNVNEVLAKKHPEYHALRADGRNYNDQILQDGTELFWTWLCPNRGPWVEEFLFPHIAECINKYPVDGVFIDMAAFLPGTCFCDKCLAGMKELGLDPHNPVEHVSFNYRTLQDVTIRLRKLLDSIRPDLRIHIGSYNAFGQAHKAKGVTGEFYLESLAFQTGWEYFPMAARYYRNFGMMTAGMTGRFLKNWGDFGTIVSPHQLKTQMSMHLMAGIPSGIGDHLHCNGKINSEVYKVIGEAFDFISKRQPHCVGMEPGREAAVLVPVGRVGNAAVMTKDDPGAAVKDAYTSACKLMAELHLQYDLITPDISLEQFKVLVVSEDSFGADFAARTKEFVENGGLLIAGTFGLNCADPEGKRIWSELTGVESCELSENQGMFYEPVDAELKKLIPDMPNYVHCQGVKAEFADNGAETLAEAWYSPNVRCREAHYGHFHGPAAKKAGPAITFRKVGKGAVAVIRPQIFAAYLLTGYHAHRETVDYLVKRGYPESERFLSTNAPSIVDIAWGHKNGKIIVQVMPLVVNRRYRYSFESMDELIDIHGIEIDLNKISGAKRVYDPVTGADIPFAPLPSDGIRISLPPISEHMVIAIDQK